MAEEETARAADGAAGVDAEVEGAAKDRPVSVRMTPAVKENLARTAQQMGMSQGALLQKLLSDARARYLADGVPGMDQALDEFNAAVDKVVRLYGGALDSLRNARETAKAEFETLLATQADHIARLRADLEAARIDAVSAREAAEAAAGRVVAAEEEAGRLREAAGSLTGQLADKQAVIEGYEERAERLAAAEVEMVGLRAALEEARGSAAAEAAEAGKAAAAHEAEIGAARKQYGFLQKRYDDLEARFSEARSQAAEALGAKCQIEKSLVDAQARAERAEARADGLASELAEEKVRVARLEAERTVAEEAACRMEKAKMEAEKRAMRAESELAAALIAKDRDGVDASEPAKHSA